MFEAPRAAVPHHNMCTTTPAPMPGREGKFAFRPSCSRSGKRQPRPFSPPSRRPVARLCLRQWSPDRKVVLHPAPSRRGPQAPQGACREGWRATISLSTQASSGSRPECQWHGWPLSGPWETRFGEREEREGLSASSAQNMQHDSWSSQSEPKRPKVEHKDCWTAGAHPMEDGRSCMSRVQGAKALKCFSTAIVRMSRGNRASIQASWRQPSAGRTLLWRSQHNVRLARCFSHGRRLCKSDSRLRCGRRCCTGTRQRRWRWGSTPQRRCEHTRPRWRLQDRSGRGRAGNWTEADRCEFRSRARTLHAGPGKVRRAALSVEAAAQAASADGEWVEDERGVVPGSSRHDSVQEVELTANALDAPAPRSDRPYNEEVQCSRGRRPRPRGGVRRRGRRSTTSSGRADVASVRCASVRMPPEGFSVASWNGRAALHRSGESAEEMESCVKVDGRQRCTVLARESHEAFLTRDRVAGTHMCFGSLLSDGTAGGGGHDTHQ